MPVRIDEQAEASPECDAATRILPTATIRTGPPVIAVTRRVRTQSTPMRIALLLIAFLSCGATAIADEPPVVFLWPEGAPGSEGRSEPEKVRVTEAGDRVVSSVHRPSLTVYTAEAASATGAGIVVMPGGGHRELWTDHEGHRVAAWLAAHGVSAFVLKYRLAREEGSRYTVDDHALADARRALRTVRRRATEWRVDPQRLGVMGFSAGGELASLASMRAEPERPEATDAIERESARPAFQVLVYPGRSANILPAPQAPPAFLLCGADDRQDIAEGLASVYLRFKQAGVPVELHIYSGVGHGFGLRASQTGPVAHWPDRVREWMEGRALLKTVR
jgi:endo-1,4-beta-xylanase